MEPEVGAFLARIAKSISLVLLWMLINTFFGIRKGLFFFDEGVTAWSIVFYIWFAGSGISLFWFILKIWKAAPTYDPREDAWSYKQDREQ